MRINETQMIFHENSMTKLLLSVSYKKYIIEIYEYEAGRYSFEMLDSKRQLLCNISLMSLKKRFTFDNGNLIHNQHNLFGDYDYYQDDMGAIQKQKGYCSSLQEFFITKTNSIPFKIDNIYSSYEMVLPDGIKFWDSQVHKGKAAFDIKFQRYKLNIIKERNCINEIKNLFNFFRNTFKKY